MRKCDPFLDLAIVAGLVHDPAPSRGKSKQTPTPSDDRGAPIREPSEERQSTESDTSPHNVQF